MATQVSKCRIADDAVNLAVEWKYLLQRELLAAAERLAGDSEVITVSHLYEALPAASQRLTAITREQSSGLNDAQRRAA